MRRTGRRIIGSIALVAAITATPLAFAEAAHGQTQVLCAGFAASLVGTEGNDTLIGTNGVDIIAGLGGNDIIFGLGGTDVLCGGEGRDRIDGGRQRDWLLGGDNGDLLKGGTGADIIEGNRGNDRLIGGNGDDIMIGGGGNVDRMSGRGGSDTCADPKATTLFDTCEFVQPAITDTSLPPAFGAVELEPGFTPDPFVVDVISGGTVDLSYRGCNGFVASAPDLTLTYGDGGDYLLIYVDSLQPALTGLAIESPGGFSCHDEFANLLPGANWDDPPAGDYFIWITSPTPDQNVEALLTITEFRPDDLIPGG